MKFLWNGFPVGVIVIILIVCLICTCIFLKLIINVLYYWINKEKILKYGEIERGVIKKIEYNVEEGQYRLIVELNGEKIKSLYFTKNSVLYAVGDEIDVIIYKGRKFVKLYNMQ